MMIMRAMVICLTAVMTMSSNLAGQEICPPEEDWGAFLLRALEANATYAARAAEAGLPDFASEDARVLRDDTDARVCIALMEWAESLPGQVGPLRHWNFYQSDDRYIVISRIVDGKIRLDRSAYLAILDLDFGLKVLIR